MTKLSPTLKETLNTLQDTSKALTNTTMLQRSALQFESVSRSSNKPPSVVQKHSALPVSRNCNKPPSTVQHVPLSQQTRKLPSTKHMISAKPRTVSRKTVVANVHNTFVFKELKLWLKFLIRKKQVDQIKQCRASLMSVAAYHEKLPDTLEALQKMGIAKSIAIHIQFIQSKKMSTQRNKRRLQDVIETELGEFDTIVKRRAIEGLRSGLMKGQKEIMDRLSKAKASAIERVKREENTLQTTKNLRDKSVLELKACQSAFEIENLPIYLKNKMKKIIDQAKQQYGHYDNMVLVGVTEVKKQKTISSSLTKQFQMIKEQDLKIKSIVDTLHL